MTRTTRTFWQRARDNPEFQRKVLGDFQRVGLPAEVARKLIRSKAGPPETVSGLEGVSQDLNRQIGDLSERLDRLEASLQRLLEGGQTEDQGLQKALNRLANAAYRDAIFERKSREKARSFMAESQSIAEGRRPRPKPKDALEAKVRALMDEAAKPVRRRRD